MLPFFIVDSPETAVEDETPKVRAGEISILDSVDDSLTHADLATEVPRVAVHLLAFRCRCGGVSGLLLFAIGLKEQTECSKVKILFLHLVKPKSVIRPTNIYNSLLFKVY